MKFSFLIIFVIVLFINACNQNDTNKTVEQTVSSIAGSGHTPSTGAVDDFSDLKKKEEEGCSAEEEQAKKLMEASKKPFQLQGKKADEDCTVQ